ncbi:MAG: transketolase [Anaerolineales bacterium]|nr:transketolase [Anaerolineales bacterium]
MNLQQTAVVVRQDILTMIHAAQSGHPGGSLSAADLVTALYFHILNIDPERPGWPDRDRFLLSKGHACPVLYAALAERGYFPREELKTLRQINGRLQGHPIMGKPPGVDMTTGSLGHGVSLGIGMALGLRLAESQAKVTVLLGDGELNEGLIWEAAMAAAKFQLGNLLVIVDYNNLQLDGTCEEIMPLEPLEGKWQAFGWDTQCINGHDFREILPAVEKARILSARPQVILAHTVKGKGVSFMENECDWHGRAPNDNQLAEALRELEEQTYD